MTNAEPLGRSGAAETTYEIGFKRQIAIAATSFWESPVRNRILLVAAALLTIILLTAYGQVLLNRWNAPFYNSLERRDLPEFIVQLKNFAFIAGFLLLLNVVQTWLNQTAALYMREGLSRDIVDQWLTDRRAYRLSLSSPLGVNPDQRLHEDARKLSEMTTSLTIGLVQATILLISFIGVLWQLSSGFVFHVGDTSFSIPGYMVWGAIFYASIASLASNLVGFRLTRINAERYAREADLRFSLMRTNENLEAIALARGEENQRQRIHSKIDDVVALIRQLAMALTNLTWVTAGFGWLALVVPTLIASPAYFAGTMSFGELMMSAAAFNQVHSALRWYVNNFDSIADWKATLLRVMSFRAALVDMDDFHPEGSEVLLERGTAEQLAFRSMTICAKPNGNSCEHAFRLREPDPVINFGERVMINGDQGVNRKLLFDALAGLWPWGGGSIDLPEQEILFVPQLDYLPEGPLRDALLFPAAASAFSEEEIAAALTRVGLHELTKSLDEHARWDRRLEKDEQMLLAFANLLLRRPKWIVFNDVLEGLEPETVERLSSIMNELQEATLIYIGRSGAFYDTMSPRLLHLEALPQTTLAL
ncbi:MAG TPA: ABC transporter ATP-binding protein/permease [Rhizobium sp.]|nr:ABC transporter ATP-binding protein/permease [Rhizobium sp.]